MVDLVHLVRKTRGQISGWASVMVLIIDLNLQVANNKNWQIYIPLSTQEVTGEYFSNLKHSKIHGLDPKSLWNWCKVIIRKKKVLALCFLILYIAIFVVFLFCFSTGTAPLQFVMRFKSLTLTPDSSCRGFTDVSVTVKL